MDKTLFAYAWDFQEEGPQQTQARMEALGATSVAVAASYHAGKFLRPRATRNKVYFPEDGTVYFDPDQSRYGALKPARNSQVPELNLFQHWNSSLRLEAWTVLLHNSRLGTLHPEHCARNAWGDPYLYSLCPAHPEVQDYAVHLCEDLARHEAVSTLTLETPGWLPSAHGYHHEFALTTMDPRTEFLLGLCFSEASQREARQDGIDVDALQRWVQQELERFFTNPVVPSSTLAQHWLLADLLAHPELQAFLKMRCRVVNELLQRIREALPREVALRVIPTVQRPTAGCWYEGTDLLGVRTHTDGLDSCTYQPGVTEVLQDAEDVRHRLGPEASLRFVLRPAHPDLPSREAVLQAVAGLRAYQPDGIAFYNYGFLREVQLEWVREAFTLLEEDA